MRTLFVFPAGERAATEALLDRHLPSWRTTWELAGGLDIDIDDEQTGFLFTDWDPDSLATVDAALGHHPTWAVQIDVSGSVDGTVEVYQVVTLLLEHGGVATDGYIDHAWTLQEIESGAKFAGLRFFDFRTYHELYYER